MERNLEDSIDIQQKEAPAQDLLSLKSMIAKRLRAPVGVEDFLSFLAIRKTEENLRFLLWVAEYERIFMQLGAEEKNSEECRAWTSQDHHQVLKSISARRKTHAQVIKPLFFLSSKSCKLKYVRTGSISPSKQQQYREVVCPWEIVEHHRAITSYSSSSTLIGEANDTAQEGTVDIDIVRTELNKGMLLFIKQSPRAKLQLNLSYETRMATDHAATQTIHPSVFKAAVDCTERELNNIYPEFIRSSMNNANDSRLLFNCYVGTGLILLGLAYGILTILSSMHPAFRLFLLLPIVLGITILYAAYSGVCIWILARDKYQLRQWDVVSGFGRDIELGFSGLPPQLIIKDWAELYKKRSFFQKVRDPEGRVLEPFVRKIHRKILYKGLCMGVVVGAVIAVISFFPQAC